MGELQPLRVRANPPWWRTLLVVTPASAMSLVSAAISPVAWQVRTGATGAALLVMMLGLLAAVAFPVVFAWRAELPSVVVGVAAGLAVLLPIGPWFALVALGSLIGRRTGRETWLTTAGVAAAVSWATVGDWLAQPRGASVLKTTLSPTGSSPGEPLTLGVDALVIALVVELGVAIGAGLIVRSRRQSRQQAGEANRLGDELARREERERIAREVHDVMGHRLSLLNLHAGALEVNAGSDPELAQSAQLVRESAGAALDDLRSLLGVLREPMGTDAVDMPLTRLDQVVREAFGAGQPLSSSIFVADADRADPVVSRAVYRIVQELLTNARKHAPGRTAFLQVTGSPTQGIVIDCRNPYVRPTGSPAPGTSRGLAGVAERAELLGGQVRYGLDDDGTTFRVTASLPWSSLR